MISSRQATVSVIGQGHVGLPLAVSLCNAGFTTYGIDVDAARIAQLSSGHSYILDVSDLEVSAALASGRYTPTLDFGAIKLSQVVVICVPTPLSKSKEPDVSYIVSAVEQIKIHMSKGKLIILESTTYPGTTDELIVAELEKLGYQVGEDFFVCFSPERVDPGNPTFKTKNTPKVVGGVTTRCTEFGVQLYSQVMEQVVPVSSARVAEMVKLLENTFRAVNIGLVNELALLCERMDIDIWEVVDAAATKPFGFMPFYPGPGIGGHCIPLDPIYLSWKAKMHNFYSRFIELASEINSDMPRHVVSKVAEVLNLEAKAVRNAQILILGMAYKMDIDDLRESPSLEVFRLLAFQGARVEFYDPYVTTFPEGDRLIQGLRELTAEALAGYDAIVLATDHTVFDYQWIAEHARVIVDTRNGFKGIVAPHIFKLGTQSPSPDRWESIRSRNTLAGTSY